MDINEILAIVFVSLGILMSVICGIGVLRLPDFFTRLHASGIGETLGFLLCAIGMCFLLGFSLLTFKILAIFVFMCVANPLGTHLIAKAAYFTGYDYFKEEREGKKNASDDN